MMISDNIAEKIRLLPPPWPYMQTIGLKGTIDG